MGRASRDYLWEGPDPLLPETPLHLTRRAPTEPPRFLPSPLSLKSSAGTEIKRTKRPKIKPLLFSTPEGKGSHTATGPAEGWPVGKPRGGQRRSGRARRDGRPPPTDPRAVPAPPPPRFGEALAPLPAPVKGPAAPGESGQVGACTPLRRTAGSGERQPR